MKLIITCSESGKLYTYLDNVRKIDGLEFSRQGTTNGYVVSANKGRVVESKLTNMIPLKPTDARVNTLKRDYLESQRPTKQQWKRFQYAIDSLSYLKATVKDDEGGVYMIDGVKQRDLPVPNSFPIKMKGL